MMLGVLGSTAQSLGGTPLGLKGEEKVDCLFLLGG